MNLGVVLLDDGARHPFEIFSLPIDLKPPRDALHEPLVPLEDLQRTGDPAHRQEGRVGCPEGGVRIGQPLPMGEEPRPCHPKRVEGGSADGDGMRCPGWVETERPGHSRRGGVGPLRGMIEPLVPDRSDVA